ncbi:hypothetical protein SAMN05216206_3540 [Pseudomonas guineae]|uniref:Uncharacterized protein n=2 Tax=Pseudomonas guineae TaxID=425504 RepID=A0A1I3P055_9PSED|nr:hypothetical protein SAMN05216206_3540 [Pseudomonas guineae]
MKADRHDAPEWITSGRRKRGNLAMVIPGLLGTVITIGALHFASQAFVQGTVKHLAESKNQSKPVPVAEIRRAEPQTDWSKMVEEQARRDAMSQPQAEQPKSTANNAAKQTVFNDANYTPRGADNVLPVEKNYKTVEQEKPAKKLKVTVIKETKDTTCWPLKEGSVERRNCKASVNLSRRN